MIKDIVSGGKSNKRQEKNNEKLSEDEGSVKGLLQHKNQPEKEGAKTNK